jgi:ABC-type multidrug transport system ATPase subunit
MDPQTHGSAIRARLGVVPQDGALDRELTVRENLYIYGRHFGLKRAVIRKRSEELLDFAQLREKSDSPVEALSGGMRRRLTITRSLMNNPDMVLLDEPATGLGPQATSPTCPPSPAPPTAGGSTHDDDHAYPGHRPAPELDGRASSPWWNAT